MNTLVRSGYRNLQEINQNRSPEPVSESRFRKSREICRIRSCIFDVGNAHYRTNTMSLFSVSIFNENINTKLYYALMHLIDRQYYDEDSRQD